MVARRTAASECDDRPRAVVEHPAPPGAAVQHPVRTPPVQALKGAAKKGAGEERRKGVPWTEEEHRLFVAGLAEYGKGDWRSISRNYVLTRTPTQVRRRRRRRRAGSCGAAGGTEQTLLRARSSHSPTDRRTAAPRVSRGGPPGQTPAEPAYPAPTRGGVKADAHPWPWLHSDGLAGTPTARHAGSCRPATGQILIRVLSGNQSAPCLRGGPGMACRIAFQDLRASWLEVPCCGLMRLTWRRRRWPATRRNTSSA